MKQLRSVIRSFVIQEIGNTTEGYKWKLARTDRFGAYYTFQTEQYTYDVTVEDFMPEYLAIEFELDRRHSDEFPDRFGAVTDEGKPFKVVSTVVSIARHAWENRSELFMEPEKLKGFFIDAAPKEGEDENIRAKLYKRFVERQFPSARVDISGSELKVEIR